MRKAIVIKLTATINRPDLGYVRPFIIEDENGIHESSPDRFPNKNSIFVKSGYEEWINKEFDEDEPFRISFFENDESSMDPSSPNYCQYIADGDEARRLSKSEYFHVIEKEFNLQQRVIDDIPYKPKQYIFIKPTTEDFLYGPFDYDEVGESDTSSFSVRLKAYFSSSLNVVKDSILRIPLTDFSVISVGSKKILATDLRLLYSQAYEVIDYISDEQLIKWGNELLPTAEERLNRKDLGSVRKAIEQLSQANSHFFHERKTRLLNLIDKTQSWISQRSTLINEFLSTELGKEQINVYLTANLLESAKERIEKELDRRFGNLEEKRKKEQSKIAELEQQKRALEEEVRQNKEQLNQKQREELTHEIQEIEEELNLKRQQLQTISDELGVAANITSLKNEEYHLGRKKLEIEQQLNETKRNLQELDSTKKQLRTAIRENQDDLRKKLLDLKPYVDLLNGFSEITSFTESVRILPKGRKDKPQNAREFIQEVHGRLESYGREYSFEEIANYLICIHQNFMTILVGLPGVGKTSPAIYLAKATGLGDHNRLLFVPTSRGWTSQRDILGFYNPLSQRYQPSSTGLYEALRISYLEKFDSSAIEFPYWILLDEANLSPLEHYWSTFLVMCDGDAPKEIVTGEPGQAGKLIVPESVRFIATVNYDNTTEPLSPRMIDRVPIIRVNPSEGQDHFEAIGLPSIDKVEELLSYQDFDSLFKSDLNENLINDERRILNDVIKVLQLNSGPTIGFPIIVSPRKRHKIGEYCRVARDLMKEQYELRALDFAVAQYILPLLNGNGEKHRNRLNELLKVIEALDYSKEVLKQIIEVGDSQHQFYNYFF